VEIDTCISVGDSQCPSIFSQAFRKKDSPNFLQLNPEGIEYE
jgi:hypothetical protein